MLRRDVVLEAKLKRSLYVLQKKLGHKKRNTKNYAKTNNTRKKLIASCIKSANCYSKARYRIYSQFRLTIEDYIFKNHKHVFLCVLLKLKSKINFQIANLEDLSRNLNVAMNEKEKRINEKQNLKSYNLKYKLDVAKEAEDIQIGQRNK